MMNKDKIQAVTTEKAAPCIRAIALIGTGCRRNITDTIMNNLLYEELTYEIIGAGREVHKELGPGYLELVYEDALCYELNALKIAYQRQQELDIHYKDVVFERRFCADLLVENKVLLENKATRKIAQQDEAQLINYLKTTKFRVGLLYN
jgi:GxxExxY protein